MQEQFDKKIAPDSVWHRLTAEQRMEVTRAQLKSFLVSAESADDQETEWAIDRLAKVFW